MQRIAFTMIAIGVLIVIGYAAWEFFGASEVPLALRIAAGVVGVGLVTLLVAAIRDRAKSKKGEHFKEMDN